MKLLKNIILISCFLIGSLNNPAFANDLADRYAERQAAEPSAGKTGAKARSDDCWQAAGICV